MSIYSNNNNNGGGTNNTTRRTARGTEYIVPVVVSSPTIPTGPQQLMSPRNYHPCFFSYSSTNFPEVLEAAHQYLVLLESILRQRGEANWDKPPNRKPPRQFPQQQQQQQPSAPTVEARQQSQQRYNNPAYVSPLQSNRFAAFQANDDDDTSSGDDEQDDMDEEAGDEPLLNMIPLSAQDMSMRRLLIRVLTNQSEIFAALANQFRHLSPPQWTAGAEKLSFSLACIHEALMLADSEISRWLEAALTTTDDWQVQKSGLYQDADIVQVSIESLTVGRELYLKEVKRVEAVLISKLQPQWQTRDEVKAKMGQKWFKNPAPKLDFARLRQETEAQLRDVQSALQHLEAIQTGDLTNSTERLRNRLATTAEPVSSSSPQQQKQQQRYNGQRPTDLSRRVDIMDYPDPTTLGWTFTGSSGNTTEFFEKNKVKLDWYFTTATVKTSMDHPTRGKTQLFGAKVDPPTYRQILQNPRHHTGQRYHNHRGRGDQKQKQQRRR